MSIDNTAPAPSTAGQRSPNLSLTAADMTLALSQGTALPLSRHITHIVRHQDAWWQQNATSTHWVLITAGDTIAFLDAHRDRLAALGDAEHAARTRRAAN
jgi:hypothetical protein